MSRKSARKTRGFVKMDAQLLRMYLPIIGPNGHAVYTALKLRENRRTGQCNPSYQTIADDIGLSRPTVVKYVRLLEILNLIKVIPIWTSIGDRSSNQYVFVDPAVHFKRLKPEPIPPPEGYEGGGTGELPPPAESENLVNHPGKTALPYPEELNQEEITRDITPQTHEETPKTGATSKQRTCPHPAESVHHLDPDINICNHCFGLLDDNGQLVEELSPVENAA